ncbi:MAG: F0F1 ATP synthase subunit epsilon, partial [Peptococcaceae bacterium]|nr:F0F1 ATP synthase subunit epsilon [Peptococcaceae bacterium]
GGFLEARNSKVVVLADAAERAEDIDLERAQAARERAEQRLAARDPDVDPVRAEIALKKALNRLKATEEHQVH